MVDDRPWALDQVQKVTWCPPSGTSALATGWARKCEDKRCSRSIFQSIWTLALCFKISELHAFQSKKSNLYHSWDDKTFIIFVCGPMKILRCAWRSWVVIAMCHESRPCHCSKQLKAAVLIETLSNKESPNVIYLFKANAKAWTRSLIRLTVEELATNCQKT